MNTADLVFVGFNRRVAALNRRTGDIVWEWKASNGTAYVSLLLDGGLRRSYSVANAAGTYTCAPSTDARTSAS